MFRSVCLSAVFILLTSSIGAAHDGRHVCNGVLIDDYLEEGVLEISSPKHRGYEWIDLSQVVDAPVGYCVVVAKPRNQHQAFVNYEKNHLKSYVLYHTAPLPTNIPNQLLNRLATFLSNDQWTVSLPLNLFGFDSENKPGAFVQGALEVDPTDGLPSEPYEISFVQQILEKLSQGLVLFSPTR